MRVGTVIQSCSIEPAPSVVCNNISHLCRVSIKQACNVQTLLCVPAVSDAVVCVTCTMEAWDKRLQLGPGKLH